MAGNISAIGFYVGGFERTQLRLRLASTRELWGDCTVDGGLWKRLTLRPQLRLRAALMAPESAERPAVTEQHPHSCCDDVSPQLTVQAQPPLHSHLGGDAVLQSPELPPAQAIRVRRSGGGALCRVGQLGCVLRKACRCFCNAGHMAAQLAVTQGAVHAYSMDRHVCVIARQGGGDGTCVRTGWCRMVAVD